MANSYDIPSWAGKPPTGLHLDVLKEEKLVQKLMVDQKRCYLFGRNAQMNDFCIDHASCSRVHSAFVYHKHLNIAYLVDLGSTHGTFIGAMRLEAHKPTQLPINSTFHFGASTRNYILRERPSGGRSVNIMEDLPIESSEGALLGLPESQTELDNLTEYNTAHNRRISMLGIADDNLRKQNVGKPNPRKRRHVTFNDEEIVINPEDVDPTVGRFRNLVQTVTIVPAKKARFELNQFGMQNSSTNAAYQMFQQSLADMKQPVHKQPASNHITSALSPNSIAPNSLYQDLPEAGAATPHKSQANSDYDVTPIAMGTKLGLLLPNPAPDVDIAPEVNEQLAVSKKPVATASTRAQHFEDVHNASHDMSHGPQKKKYAKEAWPGRKQPMMGPL